jgi:EAL domain-containing protein (putative c-di-GMP-specific phosphodiesterase class I)/CheY-like chemotaxis protein
MSVYSPRQFKVLCIEDEPEILRDIADELADHGFMVDQAPSAEAALPQIDAGTPDLIICDMQMPGMNGLQLLQKLRARGDAIANVPFVFLTAFGDRETAIHGRKAGADDYLVKPVDFDLLIAAVESHLRNAAQREAATRTAATLETEALVPGYDQLIDYLATQSVGMALAVIKMDTQPELARRFDGKSDKHFNRLILRLAHSKGLRVFRLQPHVWIAAMADAASLQAALAPMVQMELRDRLSSGTGLAKITHSVVLARTSTGEAPPALIDRMMESARLLQREGGARMLELEGPELSELRLAGAIRSELVGAIDQGELHVHFQPKVDAETGLPRSGEVLVRWQSPLLGHLSPAMFIPVVERAGLLPHVTDWVLQQTALAQVALVADGLPARLAVNIGASEFNADLPDRITRIFQEYGADESLLEVEVTETSVLTDPAAAEAIVQALHARGITVALDDFGTGYSSLSHLQNCTIDTIKIDRSFVTRVAEAGPEQTIVLGIIGIARMLGMETVAEGVELESQRAWLALNACDTLQGYMISRPVRFEDYRAWLADWSKAA